MDSHVFGDQGKLVFRKIVEKRQSPKRSRET